MNSVADRSHTVNLFSYDIASEQVVQLTHHDDYDIMNASAGADAIVYEQAGHIWLLDARSGEARRLEIEVSGDLPWARPQFRRVAESDPPPPVLRLREFDRPRAIGALPQRRLRSRGLEAAVPSACRR